MKNYTNYYKSLTLIRQDEIVVLNENCIQLENINYSSWFNGGHQEFRGHEKYLHFGKTNGFETRNGSHKPKVRLNCGNFWNENWVSWKLFVFNRQTWIKNSRNSFLQFSRSPWELHHLNITGSLYDYIAFISYILSNNSIINNHITMSKSKKFQGQNRFKAKYINKDETRGTNNVPALLWIHEQMKNL